MWNNIDVTNGMFEIVKSLKNNQEYRSFSSLKAYNFLRQEFSCLDDDNLNKLVDLLDLTLRCGIHRGNWAKRYYGPCTLDEIERRNKESIQTKKRSLNNELDDIYLEQKKLQERINEIAIELKNIC